MSYRDLKKKEATGRAWRQANREHLRAKHRDWVATNRERSRAAYNAWAAANRDKISEKNRRARERRRTARLTVLVRRWVDEYLVERATKSPIA